MTLLELFCQIDDFATFYEAATGQRLLTDEFTRRSLAIRCGTAFTSMDVKAVLKAAFKTNGVPAILRSDNGPEFIAHDLGEWLAEQGVIRKHIDPGKPWQNGIAV